MSDRNRRDPRCSTSRTASHDALQRTAHRPRRASNDGASTAHARSDVGRSRHARRRRAGRRPRRECWSRRPPDAAAVCGGRVRRVPNRAGGADQHDPPRSGTTTSRCESDTATASTSRWSTMASEARPAPATALSACASEPARWADQSMPARARRRVPRCAPTSRTGQT